MRGPMGLRHGGHPYYGYGLHRRTPGLPARMSASFVGRLALVRFFKQAVQCGSILLTL